MLVENFYSRSQQQGDIHIFDSVRQWLIVTERFPIIKKASHFKQFAMINKINEIAMLIAFKEMRQRAGIIKFGFIKEPGGLFFGIRVKGINPGIEFVPGMERQMFNGDGDESRGKAGNVKAAPKELHAEIDHDTGLL